MREVARSRLEKQIQIPTNRFKNLSKEQNDIKKTNVVALVTLASFFVIMRCFSNARKEIIIENLRFFFFFLTNFTFLCRLSNVKIKLNKKKSFCKVYLNLKNFFVDLIA